MESKTIIMHLESEKNTVNKSQEELFNFLTEVKNYETIMPDSIQKFEVKGEDSFLRELTRVATQFFLGGLI